MTKHEKNLRLPIVGVIGPSKYTCTPEVYDFGFLLGNLIAKMNMHLVSGGLEGIMESVSLGFMNRKRKKGISIGISPYDKKGGANPYTDIVIPSGIGVSRNAVIVNTADVIVAVAGGAGTLSEIAFAWQKNKHVVCYDQFDGWAKELGNTQLDNRRRKLLHSASSLKEIQQIIELVVKKE